MRSLDSYAQYYERWSAGWEAQALLRAVPVAGDADLGQRFTALIDPLRYPRAGLSSADLREMRRIKARVEAERLPRGVAPRRHLKLGPGGLADVEWTAQLLQLQHAAEHEGLRTTSTLGALRAAEAAGCSSTDDRPTLEAAWVLASTAAERVGAVARALDGRGPHRPARPRRRRPRCWVAGRATAGDLEDEVLRTMRHARLVVERVFYG